MGPLQFCEVYLQELDQVPTVNTGEKSPMLPAVGKGKETVLKYARIFLVCAGMNKWMRGIKNY